MPEPMKYPRLVQEGDQLWLRCQVDGVEREVEITIWRALDWVEMLAKALRLLARR